MTVLPLVIGENNIAKHFVQVDILWLGQYMALLS